MKYCLKIGIFLLMLMAEMAEILTTRGERRILHKNLERHIYLDWLLCGTLSMEKS
jgi:hypothetical protein